MYTFKKRFWSKVNKTNTCWLWTGAKNPYGYGYIYIGKRPDRFRAQAHRISYEFVHPDFDKSLCVLHKCDVRNCVNPDHLFLGTRTENSKDKVQKNRQAKGIKSNMSNLTDEDILTIRAQEGTNKQIAHMFKVDPSLISRIKNVKIWRHVTS